MTNDSIGARNIDDAIDRAVRELVQLDPLPGLRFRVLARLERPRRGGGSGWLRSLAFARASWEPLAPVAIIAIALTILVPRFFRDRPAEPAVQNKGGRSIGRVTSQATPAAGAALPAPTPAIATAAPPPASSKRAPERTPESIFGRRTDRVGAASVNTAG